MTSQDMDSPKGQDSLLARSTKWICLTIVCTTFFIDIANLGMATIALPTIQEDIGYDEAQLQWILTAYALTYGGFLMVGGRIGDMFGHQGTLKIAMFAFNIFSLACALVKDKIGLITVRALQGCAAAFTIPSAQALVAHLFTDPSKRALAFSWWGASGSMGFVLGPIFGGLFTSLVNWRWIFWFTLIVEGVLLVLACIMLRGKEHVQRSQKFTYKDLIERLDPLGICTSIPGLILLIYAVTSGNQLGWNNGAVIGTLVAAFVLLILFVLLEWKVSRHPLIPLHMRSVRLMAGCAIAALTYGVWQGANYILTLELQDLGFSPLSTAVHFLPLGVSAFAVNMIVPHLLFLGPRTMLIPSWVVVIVGVLLLSFLETTQQYWRYDFPGMILYIIGACTAYFVTNVTVVASAPLADQGSVAGVFNMSLNVGGAVLGTALLTVVSNSVRDSSAAGQDKSARLRGYRAAFYTTIGYAALALFISFFMRRSKPDSTDTAENETHVDDTDDKTLGARQEKDHNVNAQYRSESA